MYKNKIIILFSIFTLFFFGSFVFAYETKLTHKKIDSGLRKELGSVTNDLVGSVQPVFKRKLIDDKSNIDLVEKAKKRKEILEKIALDHPDIVLEYTISPTQRALLPQDVKPFVEEFKQINGQLKVVHIDALGDKQTAGFKYYLDTKEGRKKISTSQVIPPVRSGVVAYAQGVEVGGVFVAQNLSLNTMSESSGLNILGEAKILVLLVNFENSEKLISPKQAHELVFNGQTQKFYQEQSYNKVSLVGDTYGWIEVARPYSHVYCGDFGLGDEQEIDNFVRSNVNLSNYDHIVFLFSAPGSGGGCSEVGKSTIEFDQKKYTLSTSWIPLTQNVFEKNGKHPFSWTNFDAVLAHELGHAFGVMHANALLCPTDVLHIGCVHAEYGNLFDLMGFGIYSLHFNAFYKELFGWIPPFSKRILDITKTGHYSISPLEMGEGRVMARIKNPYLNEFKGIDQLYYLEYRRPIGFDSGIGLSEVSMNMSGLFVNQVIDRKDGELPFPRLIDASFNVPNEDDDATFPVVTDTFILKDEGRGITIGPVATSTPQEISFFVTLDRPTCKYFSPTVIPSTHSAVAFPGQNIKVQVKIIGNDYFGCGASEYTITPQLPVGWENLSSPNSRVSLGSQSARTVDLEFKVGQNQAPRTLSIPIVVRNAKSGKVGGVSLQVQVK